MAKLPEITYGQASRPTMQGISTQTVLREAAARQDIADAVFEAGGDIAEMRTKAETTDAVTGMTQGLLAFEQETAGKAQFTREDLKDVDLAGLEEKEVYQPYEVRPRLLENRLRTLITEQSEKIRHPQARREWIAKAEQQAAGMIEREVGTAASQRLDHELDLAKNAVTQAQTIGAFDLAAENIDALPIPEELKAQYRFDNNQLREMSRLDTLTNQGTSTQLEAEIEKLEAGESPLSEVNQGKALRTLRSEVKRVRGEELEEVEAPYYASMRAQDEEALLQHVEDLRSESYSGPLEDDERDKWIGILEADIKAIRSAGAGAEKIVEFNQKRDFQQVTENAKAGLLPTPGQSRLLTMEAKRIVEDPDASDGLRTAAQNFLDIAQFDAVLREAYQEPPEAQQKRITELLAGDRSARDMALVRQLETVRDRSTQALASDSMAHAARVGMKVTPLPDIQNPSYFDALGVRDGEEVAVYDRFGQSTGLLTGEEADAVTSFITRASAQELKQFAAGVEATLEGRAGLFWDQVTTAGGGAYSVAGGLDQQSADRVILGQDYRKEDIYTAAELKAHKADALEEMGSAYGENGIQRSAVADAAVNYLIASEQLGLDVDIEDAVAAVTTGIISFNGVDFQAPEDGVSSQDFRFWTENLEAEELPFIRQGTGEDIVRQIRGGGINFIPAGQGQYFLQRVDTGTYLTTGGDANQRATIAWPGLQGLEATRQRLEAERAEHFRTGQHGLSGVSQ